MGFTDSNYTHLQSIFFLWVISLLLLSNPGFGAEATDTPLGFITIDNPELDSIGGQFATVQDQQGFMWFGGDSGLARYDGYNAKVYRNDPQDPHSLSNNNVHDLFLDARGRLWVATLGGGLNLYDPSTDRFTRYQHDPGNPHSLSHDAVFSLSESKGGKLWVATFGGGLNLFDLNSQRFTRYQHNATDPNSISSNNLQTVYEDNEGLVWIGTTDAGLNRFNPQTGAFSRFSHDSRDPASLGHNDVWTIYEDNQHQLWVGTRGGGLNRLDKSTGKFIRYLYDPQNSHGMKTSNVSGIAERDDGTLWVTTEGGGLNLLDPATGRFKHYLHRPDDPLSLPSNKLRSLYQDKDGDWWFGHFPGGVSRLNPYASAFSVYRHEPQNENSLSHNSILGLTEDDLGNLWVGTEGGLNYLDRAGGAITRYIHDPQDPGSLAAPAALAVLKDSYGQVWVGTWGGGLDRLNSETGTFVHYLPDTSNPHSISSDSIWSLYEDADQNLWVGTGTDGLNRYDRETNSFSVHRAAHDNPASLTPGQVLALYEDSRGLFWVGTSGGLNLMDPETGSFTQYLHREGDPHSPSVSYIWIWCITEDSKARLWLGTGGGGLNRLDRETGRFTSYRAKDGLPGESVSGILEDDQGYLWLSTERGLSRFDPRTEEFRNYNTQHGLPGNVFNRSSFLKTSNGELVFGSTAGLTIFNPANFFEDVSPPSVVITDFELFNQPVEIGVQNSPLQQSINHTKKITLRHDQSVFSLAFAALNYRVPKNNQYAYQLEGFEKNWNYVGNKRTAAYTNLDPGHYVFRIKAANSEGVWNEEGTSIKIRVLPPWWQTWWAYVLYSVVVSAVIIIYVRSHRKELAYMGQIVEQRTGQLRQAKLVAEKEMALRESEAKFSAAFELASIGKVLVSAEGQVLRVNPAFCALLGYSAPELLTMTFKDFTHPDDVTTSAEHMTQLVAGVIEAYEIEKRYLHRDGHVVWAMLNVSIARPEEGGTPEFCIAEVMDITARKMAEAALIDANRELLRSNAELQQFAYVASHDLVEPLRSVSSSVQLLQKRYAGELDARADEFIEHAVGGSKRMQALIEDLLAFARIGSGSFEQSSVEMATILAAACDNLQAAITESNASITHDTLPLIVVNESQWIQLLQNLMANAIKFRGDKPAVIHVGAKRENNEWVFSVADQGIGIEPQFFQRIFELFKRLHSRTEYSGTGVGLALCEKIVSQHGGRIWLESTFGQGATFYFTLPVNKQAHRSLP